MYAKFLKFLQSLKNKNIAVIGLGISNEPLLKILVENNLNVTAFDGMAEDSKRAIELKEKYQANWSFGANYLSKLIGFDYIFRTPALMPHNSYLEAEKAQGALITSEMELFLEFCPAKVFGVTGSDGKSTTSSLIATMLEEQGYKVYLGGNIGQPLLDQLDKIKSEDMVVVELSSFQLIDLNVSPQVAVFTNITPNHLNIHKDFSEYLEAKKQIYRHQKLNDKVIINGMTEKIAQDFLNMKGEVIWFNKRYPETKHRVFLQKIDKLGYQPRNSDDFIEICSVNDLRIIGSFNRQNALASMAAVIDYVEPVNIKKALRNFKGLKHRLEFVREVDHVKFYESSIDSSPERSKNSISAFIELQRPLILIMGGQDKNLDYSGLGKSIAAATDRLILCGENSSLIDESLKNESHLVGKSYCETNVQYVKDYKEAVKMACRLARPGDSVLLSPAGTSFDNFNNFMERGNHFKKIVNQI
ncbi:MAG: UDP-N-acetylmuramoyl-L-alanine--D-glutamate ligase [Clostridiaceae bacterium]|nr:UDP-N-acetylmuramoyl-L-alanine--D-glutamate ligase [Clostridiaceae bacterium]